MRDAVRRRVLLPVLRISSAFDCAASLEHGRPKVMSLTVAEQSSGVSTDHTERASVVYRRGIGDPGLIIIHQEPARHELARSLTAREVGSRPLTGISDGEEAEVDDHFARTASLLGQRDGHWAWSGDGRVDWSPPWELGTFFPV